MFKTPLAAMVAMIMIVSALSYTACDIKKAKDADKNDELALAVILLAAASSPFPVTAGNVYSLQFRNSTTVPITVWLMGSQPPCSKAVATAGNCDVSGWTSSTWEAGWISLRTSGYFSSSGTHFYNISKAGVSTEIDILNHITLQPGETLRIVPPINSSGKPEWYWYDGSNPVTAGTNSWVTRATGTNGSTISMPAPQSVMLYEYNTAPTGVLWWDMSAADGNNVKATMTYEGAGCTGANCGCSRAMPRVCKPNLADYNGSNDGCPYSMTFSNAKTCPKPWYYNDPLDSSKTVPSWVVAPSNLTTKSVSDVYTSYYTAAGSPTAQDLCKSGNGDVASKEAYHIWWRTNPVGLGWLNYLQKNAAGTCNAYGWSYDEKRWKPGDTFDVNGNPPENDEVGANVNCNILSNTYLNIDILDIM